MKRPISGPKLLVFYCGSLASRYYGMHCMHSIYTMSIQLKIVVYMGPYSKA